MQENFERELFDLIESVSLAERASAGAFLPHLARALHSQFAGSLGLVGAAELRDLGEGYVPVFSTGAGWDLLSEASHRGWRRRRLPGLRWWVQHGLCQAPNGARLDLRLFPLNHGREHALGFLTRSPAAPARELQFQVLGQLIRLFVERHHHRARLDHILALAREQQLSLLPPLLPALPGHTVAALAIPSEEVGGDYHQLLPLAPTSTGVVVADAKGKGFEAAVLITALHTALRLVQQLSLPPGHRVAMLNRALAEQGELRNLVSLFYGELDAEGRLLYVNASHPPGLVVRAAPAPTETLSEGGLFLGLDPGTGYHAGACHLHPGDLLVLYTDGWIELFNPDNEEFGATRLRELLRDTHGMAPAAVIQRITEACDAFRREADFHDDRTLVVIRKD